MNNEPTELSRRNFLGVVGVTAISPFSFSLSGSDAFTPLAAEFVSAQQVWSFGSFAPAIQKYNGHPAWPISTAEGELDSLLSWVDASDERTLIHKHEATDTATVSAPLSDVVSRMFSEGISDASYVERIDLNLSTSKVEPPRIPGDKSAFPEFSVLQRAFMDADPASTTGLAFEAEKTTLSDALDTINDTDVVETGAGQTLGVIDTGLNYDSDYFGDRLLDASTDLTDGDEPTVGADGPEAVADGNGHGTWVTAAAAGSPIDTTYTGVASGVNILSIKALDDEGSGSTATIAAAVRYGVDNGADVLCMSLGSPFYSQDLADALEYANEQGVLVVVAAGNDRMGTRFVNYPGADPNTLAVSATTTGAPSDVTSAYFANVGPSPGTTDFSNGATTDAEVGIAAPGMAIEADLPDGYSTLSGTSMAAPFVAGAAAVVLEANSSLAGDAEALRERLETTATPAEDLAAAEAAHGLLDVAAAVSGTESEQDQEDVMTSKAESRDIGYRAESAARGGILARYVFGGGA